MDPTTQQGLSYAVVGLGGMIVGKAFDYLGARLSSRVKALEKSGEDCEKRHATCEEERKRDKLELLARDAKDRDAMEKRAADLQRQIDALKAAPPKP